MITSIYGLRVGVSSFEVKVWRFMVFNLEVLNLGFKVLSLRFKVFSSRFKV